MKNNLAHDLTSGAPSISGHAVGVVETTKQDKELRFNDTAAKLIHGDCLLELKKLKDNSVHLVLTDPPYFLDRLDDNWEHKRIEKSQANAGVIGGLPVGMKFDAAQGRALQKFLSPICKELYRVLKPGAFLLMFASPRLYHRAAVAAEDVGFEIRDAFAWCYTKKAQFKAFSMDHFVRKRKNLSASEKQSIIAELNGRKTPQLRPQFESILCAQKPRVGTFVDNWMLHQTGLIDATRGLNGKVPQTVMCVEKSQRDHDNCHLTPKPISLCEHLIQIFSVSHQLVLDPFLGSGTTCIAAKNTHRNSIGMDINRQYIEIAKSRINACR